MNINMHVIVGVTLKEKQFNVCHYHEIIAVSTYKTILWLKHVNVTKIPNQYLSLRKHHASCES